MMKANNANVCLGKQANCNPGISDFLLLQAMGAKMQCEIASSASSPHFRLGPEVFKFGPCSKWGSLQLLISTLPVSKTFQMNTHTHTEYPYVWGGWHPLAGRPLLSPFNISIAFSECAEVFTWIILTRSLGQGRAWTFTYQVQIPGNL